jgi:predicted 2-oxoglutarate/Fe(II)-dependent dioxygenase YbiX
VTNQRHYAKPYPCDPALACYCGSGKAFGECCGSQKAEREPPYGVKIVSGFMSDTDCRRLVRYAEKQPGRWLTVRDEEKSRDGQHVWKRSKDRITQVVDMSKYADFINEQFREGLKKYAEPAYGPIDWFEWPYLLRYKVGGKYGAHADAEVLDKEVGRFYKAQDRDISMLLYLNDDYTGGELTFTRLNYTYRPTAGDMVMFPSGTLFKHKAHTVETGRKYALVSWSSLHASPKLFPRQSASPRVRL